MTEIKNVTLEDLGWNEVPHDIVDKSVKDLLDLSGKTAVVTGAGGVGLGRSIAHRLAALGAEVVLVGRGENVIEASEEVAKKWNAKTHYLIGDLLDFDRVGEMYQEAKELCGGHIDILVNNAHGTRGAAIQDMTKEMIDFSINGTLTSMVYSCVQMSKIMIPQGYGKIVNISSESSKRADEPGLTVYASAKGGVDTLTRTLAGELAKFGIQVNGVAPGVMLHSRLQGMFSMENPPEEVALAKLSILKSAEDTLAKRVSIPDEVANTVAFLCSDACSYIYGQMINNGGGEVV